MDLSLVLINICSIIFFLYFAFKKKKIAEKMEDFLEKLAKEHRLMRNKK